MSPRIEHNNAMNTFHFGSVVCGFSAIVLCPKCMFSSMLGIVDYSIHCMQCLVMLVQAVCPHKGHHLDGGVGDLSKI